MNLVNDYWKTEYNRHPIIFQAVEKLLVKPKRIMSYGCSVGCETITLTKYFPSAMILGVEPHNERRAEANRVNSHPAITYSATSVGDNYDAIFCLNVLCKHPETDCLNDCSKIYPFSNFVSETGNLSLRLRAQGLLVIFNTTYFFADTIWSQNFKAISLSNAMDEFVAKFNSSGKRTERKTKAYIFQKID